MINSSSSSSSLMGSCHYYLFIFSSYFLLTLIQHHAVVDSASGPIINVTKILSFPDFTLNSPKNFHDVKLLGSAIFSDKDGSVQIPDATQATDLRHQAGRALYSSSIRLLDPHSQIPASFETTFSFQFNNATSVNSSDSGTGYGGSGLTFIIVPDEFTVGRPGPWMGMLNDACEENYKAVAVEFDTHHNPEFGDPNDNHIGINLGTIISSTTINASDVGVFLKDGSIHRAWINYNGGRRWMTVHLGSEGEDYPSKPIFSGALDLSPFLNEYMFVGFSASTGNHTQIHSVLSWNFTSTSQAFLRIPSTETCESKILLDNGGSKKNSHSKPASSFLIFIAAVILALAVFLSMCYIWRRRGNKSNTVATTLTEKKQRPRPPNKPHRFTISEISSATQCFRELEILGSDSRGVYYRGKLPNGCQVAVKKFSAQFLNSQQGLDRRRLLKEIVAISKIRHPNLVPIRGWCQDNRETMAVYEFYPNGSLDKWLFGVGVLPWTRRFKVIKDVAEALSFLHSKQLAHKNMKTSSVFLDLSFRAAVGDFGFVLSEAVSRQFESAVSQKADVFSFGIFVLEVVAGRRSLDMEVGADQKGLVDFAWRMHESEEKVKVVDQRMGSVINLEQAIKVLEIGLLCTLNESKGRPVMEEVVEFLSMERQIPELPASRPFALFPYSSTTGLCNGYSCSSFK